jgi:phenylalanyl-tRNA synthetase alpha chain
MEFKISTKEQDALLKELASRTDVEAARMKRYLSMPDLSRTKTSPLFEIVEQTRKLDVVKGFDNIIIPEIVPADISFDLFNFAPNHPARSTSDTYYVDKKNILRTHDTVMWYYYFNLPEIKERIKKKDSFGVICYGKVYRKDEIDRKHMNTFHQMGGLYMVPDDGKKKLTLEDLKEALSAIVKGVFGPDIKYRFNTDTFPYTDPSLEVEVEIKGQWIEILGGGMPRKEVLKNFNVEGYHGWAFGFGLERLAIIGMELPDIRLLWSDDERVKKQLKLGHIYKEVSKYPAIVRDISFVVDKANFAPNNYFDLVRDGKKSYAYRITYRSIDRTLTQDEVNALHKKLEERTKEVFGATVR